MDLTGGSAAGDLVESRRRRDERLERDGQRVRVVGRHQDAVPSVVQQVDDAADGGADHGHSGHEGLVDHQRRVFQPAGGDDQHVHLGEDGGHLARVEPAHESHRQSTGPLPQRGGVVGKDLRVPEDADVHAVGRELRDRVDQHVGAFVPDQRARKADPQAAVRAGRPRHGRQRGKSVVRDDHRRRTADRAPHTRAPARPTARPRRRNRQRRVARPRDAVRSRRRRVPRPCAPTPRRRPWRPAARPAAAADASRPSARAGARRAIWP